MNPMKTAPQIAFGSLVFFCAAILLPGSAAAQQLSVSPTSVSVQATVGHQQRTIPDRASQETGKTDDSNLVVGCGRECELAGGVADGRHERRHVDVDFHNVRAGGGDVSDLVRVQSTSSSTTVNVRQP